MTGAGAHAVCRRQRRQRKQDTVDAYLSGKFELGGRKHDLVVGMSSTRTASRTDGYIVRGGLELRDPQHLHLGRQCACTHLLQRPAPGARRSRSRRGLFASARWRVTDPLSVLTGLRLTDWHRHSDTYGTTGAYAGRSAIQDENRKVTPFIGRGVRHHAHAVGLCQLRAHLQPAELQGPQQQSAVARHRQQCRGWA